MEIDTDAPPLKELDLSNYIYEEKKTSRSYLVTNTFLLLDVPTKFCTP
ncbi:hypothetical protein [Neptunitalea chrysea]|nr:hypothetical protein [Neptunitalea chrysea]